MAETFVLCTHCRTPILSASVFEMRSGVLHVAHGYCWHVRERAECRPGLDAAVAELRKHEQGVKRG